MTWKYTIDTQSATAENRRRKDGNQTTAAKYNGLPYWAAIINHLFNSHQPSRQYSLTALLIRARNCRSFHSADIYTRIIQ